MPRILGVDIPKNKKVRVSLQYLYGIGNTNVNGILKATNIDGERKASTLSDEEVAKLTKHIQSNCRIEGELRREISQNIRRLMEIGCYRGTRHKRKLPVRGQRTRCNARSRKGARPRVGGIKSNKPVKK